jgi:hypothetical protein
MCAFIVGGTFIAAAGNELTWLTFGGVAALERQFKAQRLAVVTPRGRSALRAPAMPPPRRKAIA